MESVALACDTESHGRRPTTVSVESRIGRLVERAGSRGLLRSDVTAVADNALDLLVTSMVWGFGPLGYGPARTAKMLATDSVASIAAEIVETVRSHGAGRGFSALFKPSGSGRIYGLAVAMGPKLLYFACRDGSTPAPRPMVYDQWVYAGLAVLPDSEQPRLGGEPLPSPKACQPGRLRDVVRVGRATSRGPQRVARGRRVRAVPRGQSQPLTRYLRAYR